MSKTKGETMKTLKIAALLGLVSGGAYAQSTKPPDFVPFELDQQAIQALNSALGEVPAKYSIPLINFLQQQEDRAKAQWLAEHQPKPAPTPTPTDKK